jgi:LPXTG-motif cell wall-anchored protein
VAAIASIGVFGTASADDDDQPAEAYPPTPTLAPDRPKPPGEIPKTGNDGTDAWLKLGAGAVLAGGVLVTATARRRQQEVAAS